MESLSFSFHGTTFHALASGALWWPSRQSLLVADLHLGKSERIARRGGSALPPYETRDTLSRLARDLQSIDARSVICLGDSFDDSAACAALDPEDRQTLCALQQAREWVWITGNHDPALPGIDGRAVPEMELDNLHLRHIALPGARGEISAHYHPKAAIRTRARRITRPAFLMDADRLILPAYGTYTGGLYSHDPALSQLMGPEAEAILTGHPVLRLPMPRAELV